MKFDHTLGFLFIGINNKPFKNTPKGPNIHLHHHYVPIDKNLLAKNTSKFSLELTIKIMVNIQNMGTNDMTEDVPHPSV
jgi:hypothetical protein